MTAARRRILVAMSSLKGTYSQFDASQIVSETLGTRFDSTAFPIADGGRGTLKVMQSLYGGEIISCSPSTHALLWPDATAPARAVIESAEACGLHSPPTSPLALASTTRALGVLINELQSRFATSLKSIWVGLGDTITSDCGLGMLQAMGYSLTAKGGNAEPSTRGLFELTDIVPPTRVPTVRFIALCDVSNPLTGRQGSARIYGPQKGLLSPDVERIDEGMIRFAQITHARFGRNTAALKYTGAAGGLSACLHAVLHARLIPGARMLLRSKGFLDLASHCDLIVTGEGRTDGQTESGKAPWEVARIGAQLNKPVALLSGAIVESPQIVSAFRYRIALDGDSLAQGARRLSEVL